MIVAWLLGTALALDPAAVRLADEAVAVDVASESLGVAVDLGPRVGVQISPASFVSGHVGWGRALIGADRPWGVDGVGVVGLGGLLATPGVALLATGELRAGVRTDRGRATLGLVAPAGLRLDLPPQLAVPLVFELALEAHLGPVWLGCRGLAGATLDPSGPPTVRAVAAGFVRVPLERS